MKITKVGYSKTYQIGVANFEKLWMEGEITEGEEPEKELLTLKNMVEKFHKDTNPEPEKKVKPKKMTTEEQMAYDISLITEIDALNIYKASSEKSKIVKEAFDKKTKELTQ